MKTSILAVALLFAGSAALPALQTDTSTHKSAGQDMKDAGVDTKNAIKKGAHKTKDGTEKAATTSTHAVKKGTHKAASETEKGADKLKHKTSDTGTSE
jgi:hypothetical protein